MALNLVNTVFAFLKKNPEHKFTARQIAEWIFETYPDACHHQKQKRSTATVNPLGNATALLQQIVAEIGSQRPCLQKRHPEVKTTEGRPRKYYFTETTDSAAIDHAERHEASPATKANGSVVKEHTFTRSYQHLSGQNLSCIASVLMKSVLSILKAQVEINGYIPILLAWKI